MGVAEASVRVGAGWLPRLLVLVATLSGLALLYGDYDLAVVESNDRVLHKALTRYAVEHWEEHWPVDHWYPSIGGGFPVFAHYPHLSHLTSAALASVLPGADPARVYAALGYLLLSLMPVSIYFSLRRMEFGRWAAALAAALYPLLSAKPFFGIGWEAYVHRGSGLLPQLWGTFFLFPALGWGYQALRSGRVWVAGLLLGACTLSHSLYGYMAALSLGVLLLIPDRESSWSRRLGRLAGLGAVTLAATAYFVVPLVLHADQVLRSQWEPSWKWDSIGLPEVLRGLARGDLFDGGRWPVITALLAVGAVSAAVSGIRRRDRLRIWLLACLTLWVLLFAGRATWGRLVDLLPMASGLHMHRFIAGVQVFGLALAALGLDEVVRWLAGLRRSDPRVPVRRAWPAAVGALLVAVLLVVPIVERVRFMRGNDRQAAARRAAYHGEQEFRELVETLRAQPPGRVYAGMYYGWGSGFRVSGVPVYALLQAGGFEVVGFLFMAMARPGEWQVRLDYARPQYCELYNVRYIVAPPNVPPPYFARLLASRGRFLLYEVPTSGYFALGRVEPLPPDAFPDGRLDDAPWEQVYQVGLDWLRGAGPLEGRYLAWGDLPPGPAPEGGIAGTIEEPAVGPGRYACRVDALAGTDLILKVTYHPFWRCTVDGEPAEIARIFPGFMAVRLAPGVHRVRFTYRPPLWKKALFGLALVTVLACPVAALLGRYRGRGTRVR